MFRKVDALIGVLALLLLVTPASLVWLLQRQPPPLAHDPCKMLTDKIAPLLTKEIATTRVTLNSFQSAMHTEDKTFFQKYRGRVVDYVIYHAGREIPALFAKNVAVDTLREAMKNSDKHCDAILYETTVSLDYGVPMDQLRKDWVTMNNKHVIVRLPPPKVLGIAKVVLANSKRVDQQTNRSYPDAAEYSNLDRAALEDAQKQAETWAKDLGVDKACRENTKAVIGSIFAQFVAKGIPVTVEYEDVQGTTK